jgi:hypothetical protein
VPKKTKMDARYLEGGIPHSRFKTFCTAGPQNEQTKRGTLGLLKVPLKTPTLVQVEAYMNDLVMHTCPEAAAPYLGMVMINGSR